MMKYSKLLKIFLIFFLANNSFSSDYSVVRYSAWEKADVDLLYVLPAEVNTETKVLFIIHGSSRDADRYLSMWLDAEKDKNVILVAPHFKKNAHPYIATLGMASYSGKIIKDQGVWLNDSIAKFYAYFQNKYNLSSEQYLIYGFSGGSQFVHRYLMYGVDKAIEKAAIGSAGWYTFLNNEPFPFGLRNMPIERERYEWFLSRQVLFILGAKDNDPNHESLNNSRGARKQGANRFDRGTSYFENIISFSEKNKIPLRWRYKVISNLDHNTTIMSENAIPFLLEGLDY